jgi:hypothetical protein
MLTFKQYITEAFNPNFKSLNYGWNALPNKQNIIHHKVFFKTKNNTPYEVNLHSRDPKEGHFLSFSRVDKTKKTSYDRSKGNPRQVPEIINTVMGLSLQKAKSDLTIKKIHFAGADSELSDLYDGITKSKSFHTALSQHGFRYAGKHGEYHTIERQ